MSAADDMRATVTVWCVRYPDADPHYPGIVAHVRMDRTSAEFLALAMPRTVTVIDCGHEQDPPPQPDTLWTEKP